MKIEVKDITYQYPSGVLALDGVSLVIDPGQCLAIVGENGAGKSTLVKHLNGLLRPTSGQVLVGDWPAEKYSVAQLARRVSFLFQNPDEQLFERTIQREVSFGPQNLGLDSDEVNARVAAALSQVGLLEHREEHPYDLPYTQRKLIALAATLAMQTPILVLDEPTVGQDSAVQQRIIMLIKNLLAEGRTVILITHDLDFCATISDRVIVMADGKILLDASASEALAQTRILNRAAVDAPQIVRLAQSLKMNRAPLSIPAFVEEYARWQKEHS
jgi:energy-coupling factor transport system ATP-binding protein